MCYPIVLLLVSATQGLAVERLEETKTILSEAIQPHMVMTTNEIFVVAIQRGNIVVTSSEDGGETFSPAVMAIDVQGRAKGGLHRGPRIGIDAKGVLTVTAPVTFDDKEYQKRYPTTDLYFAQSTDNGQSWSKPTRVNSVAKKSPEGLHWMVVAPGGTVHVAWLDMRMRSSGQDIYLARIVDGKVGENVRVAKEVCECCAPGLAVDELGNCVLAFREGGGAKSREIFAQFSDAGGEYSKRTQVNTVKTKEHG